MTSIGLYVHIPFCDAKCHYCDFVTFTDKHSQIDSYLDALAFEMSERKGHLLRTLFIGGGTPSVLSPQHVDRLFSAIRSHFETRFLKEATVELNPESATEEKLIAFQKNGINRVSFGLQATQNTLLSKLGRLHDKKKFMEAYRMARRLEFTNINIDLMFGLPDQTMKDWDESLNEVLALGPEHVSAYALKVEPGTEFFRQRMSVNADLQADMYLFLAEKLITAGYQHYEISNFAKPGRKAQHNLMYWRNEETLGVGISSASYINGSRYKNSGSFPAYLERAAKRLPPERSEERLSPDEKIREDAMLALRLSEGMELADLKKLDLPLLDVFLERGLAKLEGTRFVFTPDGWLISNQLFQHLVS